MIKTQSVYDIQIDLHELTTNKQTKNEDKFITVNF